MLVNETVSLIWRMLVSRVLKGELKLRFFSNVVLLLLAAFSMAWMSLASASGRKTREEQFRGFLEGTFGMAFPRTRPDFLKNPATGRNLELDCFNEVLRLAVEVNGVQHYQFTPHFHSSEEAFTRQRERDILKARLCQEAGIELITVPSSVPNLPLFLVAELVKRGKLKAHHLGGILRACASYFFAQLRHKLR